MLKKEIQEKLETSERRISELHNRINEGNKIINNLNREVLNKDMKIKTLESEKDELSFKLAKAKGYIERVIQVDKAKEDKNEGTAFFNVCTRARL